MKFRARDVRGLWAARHMLVNHCMSSKWERKSPKPNKISSYTTKKYAQMNKHMTKTALRWMTELKILCGDIDFSCESDQGVSHTTPGAAFPGLQHLGGLWSAPSPRRARPPRSTATLLALRLVAAAGCACQGCQEHGKTSGKGAEGGEKIASGWMGVETDGKGILKAPNLENCRRVSRLKIFVGGQACLDGKYNVPREDHPGNNGFMAFRK